MLPKENRRYVLQAYVVPDVSSDFVAPADRIPRRIPSLQHVVQPAKRVPTRLFVFSTSCLICWAKHGSSRDNPGVSTALKVTETFAESALSRFHFLRFEKSGKLVVWLFSLRRLRRCGTFRFSC